MDEGWRRGLAAQNVTVEVRLVHPAVAGVMPCQRLPVETPEPGRYLIRLGDLYATSPHPVGLTLFVTDLDVLGPCEVAQVRVSADVLTDAGVEHRVITLPVTANLDGANHVEPAVERTLPALPTSSNVGLRPPSPHRGEGARG